jgi:TetR/AcrR family transcriptional repressor of mexCD-oprJ operon
MNLTTNENQLLKLLAVAMSEKPRSTIKELAEAVGISKATLHRLCGTRENLEMLLLEKANEALESIVKISESNLEDYKEGLKLLINVHYENKELLSFICGVQCCMDEEYWNTYLKAIDSFFLKGQKQGVFKIDFSVAVLSEIFVAAISGIIDAERRGRVASSGIADSFEEFFLHGAVNSCR